MPAGLQLSAPPHSADSARVPTVPNAKWVASRLFLRRAALLISYGRKVTVECGRRFPCDVAAPDRVRRIGWPSAGNWVRCRCSRFGRRPGLFRPRTRPRPRRSARHAGRSPSGLAAGACLCPEGSGRAGAGEDAPVGVGAGAEAELREDLLDVGLVRSVTNRRVAMARLESISAVILDCDNRSRVAVGDAHCCTAGAQTGRVAGRLRDGEVRRGLDRSG